jgi:quercetin dioxygenase-like cupin family protein
MDTVAPSEAETVEVSEGVYLTQMALGDRMSIQHLRMDPGTRIPEHDHPHEQVGFVYRGTQTFVLEGGSTVDVGEGESYAIPGDEIHAAENRGGGTMEAIDVFSPPRPDPPWLDEE